MGLTSNKCTVTPRFGVIALLDSDIEPGDDVEVFGAGRVATKTRSVSSPLETPAQQLPLKRANLRGHEELGKDFVQEKVGIVNRECPSVI